MMYKPLLPVITQMLEQEAQKQMKCLINWSVSENSDCNHKGRSWHAQTNSTKWRTFVESDCRTTRYPWYTQNVIKRTDDNHRDEVALKELQQSFAEKIGQRVIGSWCRQGYDHWAHLGVCMMPIQKRMTELSEAIDRLTILSDPSYQNVSTPWMKNAGELTQLVTKWWNTKYRSAKTIHSNRYLDGKPIKHKMFHSNKCLNKQKRTAPSSQVLSNVWTWLKIDWIHWSKWQLLKRMENNRWKKWSDLS